MGVRSAFNMGLVAFQDASVQLSNASSRIAQSGSAEKSRLEKQQPSEILSLSVERAPISITSELINLKISEQQAQRSVGIIKSADELVGTLIDTYV